MLLLLGRDYLQLLERVGGLVANSGEAVGVVLVNLNLKGLGLEGLVKLGLLHL